MKTIEHTGIVKAVHDSVVEVEIVRSSACGSCEANGSCGIEKENQIVRVEAPGFRAKPGDEVIVSMEESAGMRAVLLSYVLPLILFIIILLVASTLLGHEGWAGLAAIAVLVPYYLALWLFRARLRRSFTFRIRKPE